MFLFRDYLPVPQFILLVEARHLALEVLLLPLLVLDGVVLLEGLPPPAPLAPAPTLLWKFLVPNSVGGMGVTAANSTIARGRSSTGCGWADSSSAAAVGVHVADVVAEGVQDVGEVVQLAFEGGVLGL